MKFQKIVRLAALGMLLPAVSSCGNDNVLIGKWQLSEGTCQVTGLTFTADSQITHTKAMGDAFPASDVTSSVKGYSFDGAYAYVEGNLGAAAATPYTVLDKAHIRAPGDPIGGTADACVYEKVSG